MANTLNLIQPVPVATSLPGVQPLTRGDAALTGTESYYKESAGQTFKAGDLLYIDAGVGTVAICTTTSNSLNSPILGIAQSAATGVTGAPVLVRVLRGDDLIRMSVWHATPGSAVTAITQHGVIYRVRNDAAALSAGTGGNWVVDIQNTTVEDATTALAKVQVVDFWEGQVATTTAGQNAYGTIGDTYGQVIVRIVPFTIETDGGNIVRNLYF